MRVYAGRRFGQRGRWWGGFSFNAIWIILLFPIIAPVAFLWCCWALWPRAFWVGLLICWLTGVIVYGVR